MVERGFTLLNCRVENDVLIMTITAREIQGEPIAAVLRDEMLAAHALHPMATVIIDFHNTHYISSIAFWPLLSLHRRLQQTSGQLIVCGLVGSVGDVFYTTRLVSASGEFAAPFGLQPDVATALASIQRPRDGVSSPSGSDAPKGDLP
jgi:anti-anti-sigma regulatory factor